MQLLKLESISYAYPNRKDEVLTQANLELNEGETLGLLGNNGAGKSTLLHIASGLIAPHSGSVHLCGISCVNEKSFAKARKDLGYLLQNSEDMLFCPSILEDVAFGPYNSGKSSQEAQAVAWDTLKLINMERVAAYNSNTLSGGEKKMAAFACILAMKPKLLFLDEPTSGLDPDSRKKFIKILAQLSISSLVVSHDAEFMKLFCNKFCVLDQGMVRPVEEANFLHQ